jgi:hypothetical protein
MASTPTPRAGRARTAWRAVRDFLAVQAELQERAGLIARPWEEEFLHWSADGTLHGTMPPPAGRRRSTTRSGWCPGSALAPADLRRMGTRSAG